jgi:tetratricopeptide (TPR) repeat protein
MSYSNSIVKAGSRPSWKCALLVLALAATLATQGGCGNANGSATKITGAAADNSSQWSSDLFKFALDNLNHLEDNDCQEMLHSTQMRGFALEHPEEFPGVLPPDALLQSWPEPDMLRQVRDRLNQWVDTQVKPAPEKPDPMLAALPPDLAKLPMLADLGQVHFTAYDSYMLMEAVWLRDAARSKWAGGNSNDELLVARSLFDWTLRNIQINYDKPERVPLVPWEVLFLGHGTAWERAWTYILLLRQRHIDAAVLALPPYEYTGNPPAVKPQAGKEALKPWCIGVLIGAKEKKLYLFDPQLGLPIPGPRGIVADKSGQLDVEPATLDQVVANPKLLDAMSLGPDAPYWARKADLKRVVALVEASPIYLSPRAKRVESRLTGKDGIVLNAEPSQQKTHFEAAGVSDVRLWELPYTTLKRRLALNPMQVMGRLLAYKPFMSSLSGSTVAPLYKGRILHLKGKLFNEREAIAYYQRARPRYASVAEEAPKRQKSLLDYLRMQREAEGHKLTPPELNSLTQLSIQETQRNAEIIVQGKLAASYWLGLIEFDAGKAAAEAGESAKAQDYYAAALDYFRKRTLQFGPQAVPWATGAHYNIARTLEADGQRQQAIKEYETDVPLRDNMGNLVLYNDEGNRLRARWLTEVGGEKNKKSEETKGEKGSKAKTMLGAPLR